MTDKVIDLLSNILSDKFKTEYGKINYKFGLALLIFAVFYMFFQYKMSELYIIHLGKEFQILNFMQLIIPALIEIAFCLVFIAVMVLMERKFKKDTSIW